MTEQRPCFAIVTPIFNDIDAFRSLCAEINAVARTLPMRLAILGIDDGSLEAPSRAVRLVVAELEGVELLRLMCNLGHQRAIAVGLVELARMRDYQAVIVMDCDGEDRPEDLPRLIDAHRTDTDAVIVAQRSKRSEGFRFRTFYSLYKALFVLLTGHRIDFGNFLLIPGSMLARLAHMPEVWNHLAAAVLRSRLRVVRVPTERGRRYAGNSSMNLVSLLTHGLSAIAVFSDLVFVRLLVFATAASLLAISLAAAAILVRMATDLAIPGWASNVVGVSAIILFQAVTLSIIACLTMLGSRSGAVFIPALHAVEFVAERITLAGRCLTPRKTSHIPAQS